MHNVAQIPSSVLETYKSLGKLVAIEPIAMGQINKTYKMATDETTFILQEISPIFDTTIIDDAMAVSDYLLEQGLKAPQLIKTDDQKPYIIIDGRIFRALVFIEGKTSSTITSLTMAESAGAIVGRFHEALMDFNYHYKSTRRRSGDYLFHRENLIQALKNHASHDFYPTVEPFSRQMLLVFDAIIEGWSTTKRHAHGDPKISNIIFDAADHPVCLIDFDTLGETGWSLEMADALRSWCNPHKEDVLEAHVDMRIAEKALLGYGSVMRGHFTRTESVELAKNVQAITLCLAIRYLTDVLNERYFCHDANRFSRPAEHNLLKAQAMYRLFLDFQEKHKTLLGMAQDLLL